MIAAFMFIMIALVFYVIYESTFAEIKEEKELKKARQESGSDQPYS